MSYAADTLVSVERTLGEIQTLVLRRGADQFAFQVSAQSSTVGFLLKGKQIKFVIPLPVRTDARFTKIPSRYQGGYARPRSAEQAHKLWEQACRSRWRSLLLCIKAKLEAVDCGITTFEHEFLAHFVAADGLTIAEHVLPRLQELCDGRRMLTFGGGTKEEPRRPAPFIDVHPADSFGGAQ